MKIGNAGSIRKQGMTSKPPGGWVMGKIPLFVVLFVFCYFSGFGRAQFLTPFEVNQLPVTPPDRVLSYGDDPLQFGELRIPDGEGPHPVAIVIHGGCWISLFASLKNTAPISSAIRKLGIATWNIEYRRVDNRGGGWPGTFQDVAEGVDFLKKIAAEYNLDLNRVITVGHSAGGHLALWASGRVRMPEDSPLYAKDPLKIHGVMALSPAVDLKSLVKSEQSICGDHVVSKLLGGTAARFPQRYRTCSPIEALPLGVPQVLILGEFDIPVLKETGLRYRDRARESGDRVALFVIKKAAHHEAVAPGSVAWPTVKKSIIQLLEAGEARGSSFWGLSAWAMLRRWY
jgi:acetyl esterase/lipase